MTAQPDRYWDVHHCGWKQHQQQEAAPPEAAPVPEPRDAATVPEGEAAVRV